MKNPLATIWSALFPPKCKHPHDGQVCKDYEGSGVSLKHHPLGGPREPPPSPPRDPGLMAAARIGVEPYPEKEGEE